VTENYTQQADDAARVASQTAEQAARQVREFGEQATQRTREFTEQAAQQTREFTEHAADSGRAFGKTALDTYEQAVNTFVEYEQRAAEVAPVDWVKSAISAHAAFVHDLNVAYVKAARSVLD
jgi:hypothetical protein